MRLLSKIVELKKGEGLYKGDVLLATRLDGEDAVEYETRVKVQKQFESDVSLIDRTWKIFLRNEDELARDFELITAGRNSAELSSTNIIIGNQLFVEDGVEAEGAIINAATGPVYLGKNSKILEGCAIRNGLSLGEGSVLKMGAKIYGATTIGPDCKVGGEVQNSVLFGHSNKGHDGYLGNSVLGEWCNLGADTNTSNLKNNYDQVKLWSYVRGGFERTGEQFCGLMMGDHSKSGINTMFNTGTVVGVSANIFGAGFPRNFIPSFSWGGPQGFSEYTIKKALDTAKIVMARRYIELDEAEQNILNHVYEESKTYRNF
jgi:UDP-N-acetylglucosamine diphosphorylase/glucosamine-1-phosphate N-acetyltransferase